MTDTFEPVITLLYCGRGLANGDYLSEGTKKRDGYKVRFVMIPCASKVEVGYLIKLIEEGSDGVILAVCPQEQCQFMLGNIRAENRVNYARQLLTETGFDADRLSATQAYEISATEFEAMAREKAKSIQQLGPNPMKISQIQVTR